MQQYQARHLAGVEELSGPSILSVLSGPLRLTRLESTDFTIPAPEFNTLPRIRRRDRTGPCIQTTRTCTSVATQTDHRPQTPSLTPLSPFPATPKSRPRTPGRHKSTREGHKSTRKGRIS